MQNDCFPDATTDWSKSPVSALAKVNPRYRVQKDRVYPFVEMAAVGENFGGILSLESRKAEGSGLTRFKVGDTLFAKITPCPENGKVAFVASLPDEIGLGSTEFIVLSPKNGRNPRFLFHLVCSHDVRGRAAARMEGSTGRQRVPEEVFEKRLLVPIPSPDQQAAIAQALDVVDTALERTRVAVKSAGRLRLGILQAAFGFELSNEERKQTDAGRIPQSWHALKGKHAFRTLTGGNSSVDALRRLRNPNDADAWFMKVDDFNNPANRRAITKTKIPFAAKHNPAFRLLPIDTVVIAKRGAAILKNRVRTTRVPIALDPNLMGLQPLCEIKPNFLKYQLEWRNLSRYVEDSGVPQLNNKDLYPRWFFKAPDNQQTQIVELISAAEAKQDALIAKMEALSQLKKSLMHDLLTGRVRVNQLQPVLQS